MCFRLNKKGDAKNMKKVIIALFILLFFVNFSYASNISEYNHHNYFGDKFDVNNPHHNIPNFYLYFDEGEWVFFNYEENSHTVIPDEAVIDQYIENGCPVIITIDLFDTIECNADIEFWFDLGFNSGFDDRTKTYFFYDYKINKFQYVEN